MTDDPKVNKFLKALHQAYNERVTNYYELKLESTKIDRSSDELWVFRT